MQAFAMTEDETTQVLKNDLVNPSFAGTEVPLTVTGPGVGHTDPDIPGVDASLHLSGVTHSLDPLSPGGVNGGIELEGSAH